MKRFIDDIEVHDPELAMEIARLLESSNRGCKYEVTLTELDRGGDPISRKSGDPRGYCGRLKIHIAEDLSC